MSRCSNAASLACGLAPGGTALVAARIVQGAAAAMVAPQVIALVQLLYSPLERVARLAAFGIVGGLAAIGGPILGGLLIEADVAGLGWRLIFLVNLPVGIAALTAGWWLLPRGRSPHPLRLDPAGTLLLAAATLSLLVPAIEGRALGWPWWSWSGFALCPLLLVVFWRHAVRREVRVGSALIAPALFAAPTFRLGLAMTILFGTAVNGVLLVLSMTLQRTLGYGPLGTALLHLPFGLGVMAGIGGIGPRVLPRIGAKLIVAGAGTMASAIAALAWAVARAPAPAVLAVLLALAGIGMGCVTGPLGPVTLARVDRRHAGVAGGIHGAAQQVGGALGTAALGTIFFAVLENGAGLTAFAAAAAAAGLLLAAVAALAMALPGRIFADEAQASSFAIASSRSRSQARPGSPPRARWCCRTSRSRGAREQLRRRCDRHLVTATADVRVPGSRLSSWLARRPDSPSCRAARPLCAAAHKRSSRERRNSAA